MAVFVFINSFKKKGSLPVGFSFTGHRKNIDLHQFLNLFKPLEP